jgi:hypothetical protein
MRDRVGVVADWRNSQSALSARAKFGLANMLTSGQLWSTEIQHRCVLT